MEIRFADGDLRATCECSRLATKRYGKQVAHKLMQRIGQLEAMDNLGVAASFVSFRLHLLKGERAGQYAIDLCRGFRLVIIPMWPANPASRRLSEVTTVMIDEVTNHYA
jgi:proteic killer suppression protein